MGLFDFLNPKKRRSIKIIKDIQVIMNSRFPNGDEDINAAANELLYILNNKICQDEAREIVRLSTGISRISRDFTKERLRRHLAGYCIHHFTESQLEEFYYYLIALARAIVVHGKSPSEVKRKGDLYVW